MRIYDRGNPLRVSEELLLGCKEAAAERGYDLSPSLEVSGIAPERLTAGSGYLPLHCVIEFLNDVAERNNDELFGFNVAKYQPANRFAAVSQLIRFADTLGQAIDDATRFSLLNSEYSAWALEQEDDLAIFSRYTRVGYSGSLAQLQTLALTLTYKAMSALCSRKPQLFQVQFIHARPSNVRPLEQFFAAPILFNQPRNALIFRRSDLSITLPSADPKVYKVLRSHVEALAAGLDSESAIEAKVRHQIRQTIGSNHCHLTAISGRLGVHPRALQRRLAEQSTSFKVLLNEIRMELACDYLRNSSISLSELADVLGYRNVSALSRAFFQQAGMSPRRWQLSRTD